MKSTVHAIVLANTKTPRHFDMTMECLRSLKKQNKGNIQVIITVVETQSQEEFNKVCMPKGAYENYCSNLIFPNSPFRFNAYLQEAYEHIARSNNVHNDRSYYLISNNDVVYSDNCLFNLVKAILDDRSIKSVSPIDPSVHRVSGDTGRWDHRPILGYEIQTHLCGWSYLFDAKILSTVSFKELFPVEIEFWYQDNYYGEMLKRHSIQHALVPSAVAMHRDSQSHDLIGSHAEIKKMTYGQQEAFQALLLKTSGKKVNASDNPFILTVAIASLASRSQSFARIVDKLQQQIDRYHEENECKERIELLAVVDNKGMTVGKKRDKLIDLAQGKYIAFVDDDDDIDTCYIHDIANAITKQETDADCITFKCKVSIPGRSDKLCTYSKGYKKDFDREDCYERIPNHICAIKTSIARSVKHDNVSFGEDSRWAVKLLPHLKSQYIINEVLYYYQFDLSKSETQQQDEPSFSDLKKLPAKFNGSRLRIAVYAICKNEQRNVKQFIESIKDADEIIVCDTGSTDDTFNQIDLCPNINAYQINVLPFRFDVARNIALSLVPKDIDLCIKLDLDEVMTPGWRHVIEQTYVTGMTRLQYQFQYNDHWQYQASWIHSRSGYIWRHACHEILYHQGEEQYVTINNVLTQHCKDTTKERSSYIDLLKLAIKEEPIARNFFYLGREEFYIGKYQEAIDHLTEYLNIGKDAWKSERKAAFMMMADCFMALKDEDMYHRFMLTAMNEAPKERDPLVRLCAFYYKRGEPHLGYHYGMQALKITRNPANVFTEPMAWNETVYLKTSMCAYDLGMLHRAIDLNNQGLAINPNNEQMKQNAIHFDHQQSKTSGDISNQHSQVDAERKEEGIDRREGRPSLDVHQM